MNTSVNSNVIIDLEFNDNITSIVFHEHNKNLLITTSLDNSIRLVEYSHKVLADNAEISYKLTQQTLFDEPLTSSIVQSNNKMIIGSKEGKIHLYDLATNHKEILGSHHSKIKNIFKLKEEDKSPFFSISSDGTFILWDLRMRRSCFSYNLKSDFLCGSYIFPIFLACYNDLDIIYFNMNHVGYNFGPSMNIPSKLQKKSENIALFPKLDGYAVNSDEGRCAINFFEFNDSSTSLVEKIPSVKTKNDFVFRCHRMRKDNNDVIFRINGLKFNHVYGTFATCGSDGKVFIWDKKSRSKLTEFSMVNFPNITEIQYSNCGDFIAYACGNENNRKDTKVLLGLKYLTSKEKKEK